MEPLDHIIRGVHQRLTEIERRTARLEKHVWFASGAVAFGAALLKLTGCIGHGG